MRIILLVLLVSFLYACSLKGSDECAGIHAMSNSLYGVWIDDASTLISKLTLRRDNTFRMERSGCFGHERLTGRWAVLQDQILLEHDNSSLDTFGRRFFVREGKLFEEGLAGRGEYRKVK